MSEIKCPKCGEVFTVDENSYAEILSQVRTAEFDKEVERRLHEAAKLSESEKREALAEQEKKLSDELADKEKKLAELTAQLKAEKDSKANEQKLAIAEALKEKDDEIAKSNNKIVELEGEIKVAKEQAKLEKKNLEDSYKGQLQLKDEEIERVKEYKAQLSTKGIGEDLEKYCHNEFDKLRATAFQSAYFEKDNDAKDGTKGDFIFRDYIDDTEYISIMFEMKNEADTTATKHKNEDFLKKLDEDRKKKNCEYAVLVSMLEQDSDYYNQGIVDVSHKYEKMYVIRPQFFIQIISLLRNAAKGTLDYKKELAIVRNQNADLTNFEENIEEFKKKFGRNYDLASKQFKEAIDNIDKSISDLQKTKDKLLSSINNIRLANDKAQEDLTVKRLTKNAPSVADTLEKIREEK